MLNHDEGDGPVRVLLLEDNEDDAALILRELGRAGLRAEARWVRDQAAYSAALHEPVDVILSDYRLPGYSGLAAHAAAQALHPHTPFLILSGALGDEKAAEVIKQGVADYLLKDRLNRLGPAIRTALREARLRLERREIDERLRQSQKMEAVGQLAGGIAHDFNNLLTAINGWVELLVETEPLPDRAVKVLNEVALAGDRAMRLTQQLLLFSRKRSLRHEPLDLNATVRNIGSLLRQVIGESIALEVALHPRLPAVEGDAGSLEQVLVNLAVNARDAMPGGGRLAIATDLIRGDSLQRGREAITPAGDYVRLTVRDDGCGIPPEIQPHIFEPFFTTKEPGKGTGMGLSTAFGIVQQHRGWIEVESRVGGGTAFHVYLPGSPAPAAADARTAGPAAAAPHTGETILVVEDEETVRNLAATALGLRGYRVLTAGSGREALEVWGREAACIDLVMTDIVMPDRMTGLELAHRLRADRPALPVLFTSGYHEEMARGGFAQPPFSRFLHKPYTVRTLAGAVSQMLGAAGRAVGVDLPAAGG